MGRSIKEKGRQRAPAIKEKFPNDWLYKLLYWRELYGPVKSENPYIRMRKECLWYALLGKLKGKR